jgi:vesicle transport protein SEC22
MVRSTIIVRASDALPLAASVDDEQVCVFSALIIWWLTRHSKTESALQEHKQQAKLVFRRITPNSESRCSIESGPYILQFVVNH